MYNLYVAPFFSQVLFKSNNILFVKQHIYLRTIFKSSRKCNAFVRFANVKVGSPETIIDFINVQRAPRIHDNDVTD